MKKSKITLGMTISALSCALLAGCGEVKYSPEGYILTYTNSAGEKVNYTAEDLFGSYYEDSSKVSTMFDGIFKIIVRNYFTKENAGYDSYSEILKNAKNDVEGVKTKAKENADTNSSSYDTEWDTLLNSYSCDDEDELLEHFIYERELEEFNEQFYDNNINNLRDSTKSDGYAGYIETKMPYHVRHILVKISDTAATNYSNATIDSSNAIKLYDVVKALTTSGNSFGYVAQTLSDDSSNEKFGDLGIMDKDTSFVNEFKLGVYAYENIYNRETVTKAKSSSIAMSYSDIKEYKDETEVSDQINKIPYGLFAKLNEVNNVTLDEKGLPVNDGNANSYPRNIYFNNYLNKHSISVISKENLVIDGIDRTSIDLSTLKNFVPANQVLNTTDTTPILCTSEGQPILVVRAGTSDYQGIHFIVVQRSPLVETANGVSLSEYWTTKYPGQKDYPQTDSGVNKITYVNSIEQEVKEYKARAEEVETKIKSFDTDLNKYIFTKYLEEEKITFNDEKLESTITKWIERSSEKKTFDEKISWEKTWDEYLNTLKQQNVERENKLRKLTCAIGFSTHSGSDWAEGGACYEKK